MYYLVGKYIEWLQYQHLVTVLLTIQQPTFKPLRAYAMFSLGLHFLQHLVQYWKVISECW